MATSNSSTGFSTEEVVSSTTDTVHLHYTEVLRTLNATLSEEQRLSMLAIGLGGEVGEVLEPIKKHLYHGKVLDATHIVNEIGDVLWYLHGICMVLNVSLNDALLANILKLQSRYPEGFDAARK